MADTTGVFDDANERCAVSHQRHVRSEQLRTDVPKELPLASSSLSTRGVSCAKPPSLSQCDNHESSNDCSSAKDDNRTQEMVGTTR